MATVSFDRPVTVNHDWGIKNLEQALDDSKNMSSMSGEYKPCKKATKADVQKFVRNYKNEVPESFGFD